MYELTNSISNSKASSGAKKYAVTILASLMQPITPHLSQEIWSLYEASSFLYEEKWPDLIEEFLSNNEIIYPIQINGKKRSEITISKNMSNIELEKKVLKLDSVKKFLKGLSPKKVIIVTGKIINVVI